MDARLDGKVALVTGGGRGIGLAIARRLGQAGASVVIDDLGHTAEQAARSIAQDVGCETHAVEADVTDAPAVERMVAEAVERFGRLDVLVNNAGASRRSSLEETPESDWDAVVDSHLKGAFLCCRAGASRLKAQGGGAIVNISSTAASARTRGYVHYASAKAGLIGLTKTLALELGPHGVRSNAVAPGAVDTTMTRDAARYLGLTWDEYRDRMAAGVALGRIGDPEEVADVVCFLASPMARYVTGQLITVAGRP